VTGRLRAAGGRLHRAVLHGALRALAPRVADGVVDRPVRRILVSGGMGIGNAVMFEPTLGALRERFPGAHLAVVAEERAASLAVLRWPGLVDEVIVVPAASRLARAIAGVRLSRKQWDLCVVRFNGATQEVVMAAVLGRVPYRVGHVTSGRFRSEMDWLFNFPVTMGDWDHEVDRDLALVERLGHEPSRRAPALPLREGDRAAAAAVLGRLGVVTDRPILALQPGTSAHQQWKRWPPEHWQTLARGLGEAGFAVVALGSADERTLLDQVCRGTGAVNAAGASSLQESAAVLERAELLVCTDSALMHIAAAVGTPVLAIFGPTDRTRTRPYGSEHVVLAPADCRGNTEPCLSVAGDLSPLCTWEACLRSVRPEDVLRAVLKRSRGVAC
jgi:lipopolysaccharide heptosyltransferase II